MKKFKGEDGLLYSGYMEEIIDKQGIPTYLRHGKGISTWTKGPLKDDKYEGDHFKGQIEGSGTYHFASGSVYTGQFSNSKRSGKGKFVKHNGYKYVGDFKDG